MLEMELIERSVTRCRENHQTIYQGILAETDRCMIYQIGKVKYDTLDLHRRVFKFYVINDECISEFIRHCSEIMEQRCPEQKEKDDMYYDEY